MAKDPALLWYPNDYIAGTMGMSFEEKGAYMHLLMLQFNRGHMTTHMIGHEVGQIWDNIKDKFEQDDQGLWYHHRIDEEKEKRKKYTESRRNNKKGVNQHTKKKKTDTQAVGHMTLHMENVNVNENINDKKKVSVSENTESATDNNPTLEQVKQQAELLMITPDIAEAYHDSRMATNWLRNGKEIFNWQYDLKSFASSYKANHAGKTKAPNGTTMPNYYDARYERSLNMTQARDYHKHLLALGWKKISAPGGTNWQAPKQDNHSLRKVDAERTEGVAKRNGTTQPLNELITVDK